MASSNSNEVTKQPQPKRSVKSLRDECVVQFKVKTNSGVDTYDVHASILSAASSVFKAAFESTGFEENSTRAYTFEKSDDGPSSETVDRFVLWLYRQPLDLKDYSCKTDSSNKTRYMQQFELFIFADRYRFVDLMNHLLNLLKAPTPIVLEGKGPTHKVSVPDGKQMKWIWDSLPASSRLKAVVLSWFVYHMASRLDDSIALSNLDASHAFAKDLAVAYERRLQSVLAEEELMEEAGTSHCPICRAISAWYANE